MKYINHVVLDFSASTGVFESTPLIGNDFVWDVRIFVDPAMVLAQLGCSEYLAQFRDQEVGQVRLILTSSRFGSSRKHHDSKDDNAEWSEKVANGFL